MADKGRLTDEQRKSDSIGFYSTPDNAQILNTCWSFGPLEVCVTKISNDRVDVEIKLAGVRIGSGTLTAGNTSVCASANVQLVKAALCVKADFPGQIVWVEGEVCTRRWDGGWDCNAFKTKLISW